MLILSHILIFVKNWDIINKSYIGSRMADIEEIEQLKEYFKKLQRILMFEAEFSFFGQKLVKKSKIDDVLCCILAVLPNSYKMIMKTKEGQKYPSVLAYNLLFKAIKQKFIFNPNVYLVSFDNINSYINTITRDLEKDIQRAEKYLK